MSKLDENIRQALLATEWQYEFVNIYRQYHLKLSDMDDELMEHHRSIPRAPNAASDDDGDVGMHEANNGTIRIIQPGEKI